MPYAPRTIALLTELIHAPVAPDPAPLQQLHNELFQAGNPPYQSFHSAPQGVALSNPVTRPGAVSSAEFLPDRMRFREELTALTVDDFAARTSAIALRAARARGIPQFAAQAVVVRTLVNPRHFEDSRAFLRDAILGMREETAAFGRDPALYGMRLVFPPTPEQPNSYTLRIESFANDPRSIFVENQGTFGPIPVTPESDAPSRNVDSTYEFLHTRALAFLGQFDVRLET